MKTRLIDSLHVSEVGLGLQGRSHLLGSCGLAPAAT